MAGRIRETGHKGTKMNKRLLFSVVASVALVLFLFASCGTSRTATPRLRVELTSPTSSGTVTDGEITITGIVSNPEATVTINDEAIEVAEGGAFAHDVELAYGANKLVVRAEAEDHRAGSRTLNMTRALLLDLTSPENGLSSRERRVTVTGTVSDPLAKVYVTGTAVAVGEDGAFSTAVDLHYALTVIPVTAEVEGVEPVTKNLSVHLEPTA